MRKYVDQQVTSLSILCCIHKFLRPYKILYLIILICWVKQTILLKGIPLQISIFQRDSLLNIDNVNCSNKSNIHGV